MRTDGIADPERALSVSYAPAEARAGLAALWMLDERLGGIVASTTAGPIGQMRLTWWHDALVGLGTHLPSEPLLQSLSGLQIPPEAWPPLIEAWEVLLEPMPLTEAQLEIWARGRGETLFALAARLSGVEPTRRMLDAGRRWALVDLSFRISHAATADAARRSAAGIVPTASWPRALRSIGMLSVLAGRDLHTGSRRLGSPGRVARALWHRVTGR